jgi:hypothetical protein
VLPGSLEVGLEGSKLPRCDVASSLVHVVLHGRAGIRGSENTAFGGSKMVWCGGGVSSGGYLAVVGVKGEGEVCVNG